MMLSFRLPGLGMSRDGSWTAVGGGSELGMSTTWHGLSWEWRSVISRSLN